MLVEWLSSEEEFLHPSSPSIALSLSILTSSTPSCSLEGGGAGGRRVEGAWKRELAVVGEGGGDGKEDGGGAGGHLEKPCVQYVVVELLFGDSVSQLQKYKIVR